MLDISLINPYIRVAIHSVIPANVEIKRRIIYDYELIYIADGTFTLTYNEIDYFCKPGQFVFLRPGIPHRFSDIRTPLTQPHIHFDMTHTGNSYQVPVCFKDRPALTDAEVTWIREDVFAEYPQTPFITFSDKDKAVTLFYDIVGQPNLSALSRKAKLIQLVELILEDNFKKLIKQKSLFLPVEQQVKDYIDSSQNFTVKLDDLAKHFNYSKCYLDHCFQKQYGMGIVAYRNQIRMQTAQNMLKHASVTEVSEKLGYSSIYAFSRAYKNHFGVSPTISKDKEPC